jgi:prolyl 4-hydroxylase
LIVELESMGWHRETARRVVHEFREGDYVDLATGWHGVGPDLAQLPSSLDVGDRHVNLLMFSRRPRAFLFSGFLTRSECRAVRELAEPGMARSKVQVANRDEGQTSYARTSHQAWLKYGVHPVVNRLFKRAERLSRWPRTHMESMQVLRYAAGTEFTPHYDYFAPENHESMIERSGQRVATLLVYLNTPTHGGSTLFPDVELEFIPNLGCALLFCYERPVTESLTLHAGVPVSEGEKWLCTFFLRDRAFTSRSAPALGSGGSS